MALTASSSLSDRARAVLPGGVNSGQRQVPGLEDLIIARTEGATFTDGNGRTYVDFHSAFGPPLLGHNDAEVDAAVARALQEVDNMGVGVSAPEIELAERLVEHVPSLEKVLVTSTGSEATFHALRLARAATGRTRILKFQGCYHGWHDAVALNVISAPDRVGAPDPMSAGMMPETVAATSVVPFNDLEAAGRVLAGGDVAAVIVEPIPHNIGAVLPADGFLAGLRELCTRHGTVLVFDEVITGFRHALGGYQSICGVTPDLTTLGKAMGNGYPIGAIGGRADLMDEFSTTPGRPVFFAGTYNGHPGCVAAAIATIDRLVSEPVHEHVFDLGERARRGLTQLFESLGQPAHVSGFGSVFVTYFMDGPVRDYEDLLANDQELFTKLRLAQMEHGVFELPLNLKRSHFSYAHTDEHLDRLLSATEAAWHDLKDAG
ncbi:MAG TPA: aspartate aminotransferase family protein [Thermoleophilaceae bacterium]|jgi:glutamate-1-semialdehyde 2,1-aminomutase|nr:aspartate aminotransferase family protein [Thermoleophilaceae bacterium]